VLTPVSMRERIANMKKPRRLYAIWGEDIEDWIRELPSKVDDGEIAILTFTSLREARERAAKHYGFDTYAEAHRCAWATVERLL
jgi:hypothetical protein